MWSRCAVFAVALGVFALSGCATIAAPSQYRFESIGSPIEDGAVTNVLVRLITQDDTAVADAALFSVRTRPHRVRLTVLAPDGRGNYVYSGIHIRPGDHLFIAARIGPRRRFVWAHVVVGGRSGSRAD